METSTQTPPAQRVIHTAQLIAAMLKSNGHVSDLIFSPGRAPQIEVSGQLVELKYKGLECLSAADTKSIAYDIMGENEHPLQKLDQDGSADLSYGLAGVGRFRVNIFRQRGSCAIVMRVIPDKIPGFEDLKLPSSFCIATRKPPFTSASCIATRPRSLSLFAPRFARPPKSSWSAKCATAKPLRSLSKPPKPGTSFSPPCTPSTPRKPSSALSASFRSATSTPCARASAKRSASSFPSACFPERT